MLNLLKRNLEYFSNIENISFRQNNINKIVEKLKKDQLVIINGFYTTGKINIIKYIIKNSDYKKNYLYINKELDLENKLKDHKSLEIFLLTYKKYYGEPKIVILENTAGIDEIKYFIKSLYKQSYKIIIIGNNIKIGNKPQIEIKNNKQNKYQTIPETEKEIQTLRTKNIIFEEIIKSYSLKNFNLYNYTILFLSNYNTLSSLRETNRELNKIIKISLVTMMEYIKYSLQSKIIKQINVFDFKKNKTIETKVKYYFSDINFRNSLYNYNLKETLLKENFLYNQLDISGYDLYSGKNGSYSFIFYGNKMKNPPLTPPLSGLENKNNGIKKIETIYIDFYETINNSLLNSLSLQEKEEHRKEIKKQINKLLKVPEKPTKPLSGILSSSQEQGVTNLVQTFSKYLIIENYKELGIKKLQYENLKIVSLDELLELI